MRKLEKPPFTAKDTFMTCISIVRNRNLKDRLEACVGLIVEAETELDSKIATGEIYTIAKEGVINGNVTSKELEKVYTNRMAKKDKPGRYIYDKIFSAPRLGICPLCMHRDVETLDHYLPKSDFPRLVTAPVNLVPSCFKCNKTKLTSSPEKPEEESLHPYYDDIEDQKWLAARVIQTIPPKVEFYVDFPENWSELLSKRVEYHFTLLSLSNLYSTQSAVVLASINHRLESIFDSSGFSGVKKYLEEEAVSRFHADKNSWQTALYKAISEDNWFCNGGFRMTEQIIPTDSNV